MKSQLKKMNDSLNKVVLTQGKMQEQFKDHNQSIKDIQDPLRHDSSTTLKREGTIIVNGKIYIIGGRYGDEIGKSVEVFNWSTKTWTLIKNFIFYPVLLVLVYLREENNDMWWKLHKTN